MMRITICIFFLVFGYKVSNAQVQSVVEREYYSQVAALKNGILIVQLPKALSNTGIRTRNEAPETQNNLSSEDLRSMRTAFDKIYVFSEIYFYQMQNENDVFIDQFNRLETSSTEIITLKNESGKELFIAEYVFSHVSRKECYISKRNSKSKVKESKTEYSDFRKASSLYDPELLIEGGIIISRLNPKFRNLNKRKDLVSDFIFKSRLHKTLASTERFEDCIRYLQEGLNKDYQRSLKVLGS